MSDPVHVARSKLANAVRNGGDVEEAKQQLTDALLLRTVTEALESEVPPSGEARRAVCEMMGVAS